MMEISDSIQKFCSCSFTFVRFAQGTILSRTAKRFFTLLALALGLGAALGTVSPTVAQEKSVKPGINKAFEDPKIPEWVERFEKEGREIYDRRERIVAACGIKEGMRVGDIGAGTGLFTLLFSSKVGEKGEVFAVDISKKFIASIEERCKTLKIKNVRGVVCTQDSVNLPEASIDVAFICDTYHHFEFPHKTMKSIHKALRPQGKVVLIDFHRIEGVSSEWVMGHVRAGKEVFLKEVEEAGFKKVAEHDFLKDNYLVIFEKK